MKNKYFQNQILQSINLTFIWVMKKYDLFNKFYRKLLTGPLLLPEFLQHLPFDSLVQNGVGVINYQ